MDNSLLQAIVVMVGLLVVVGGLYYIMPDEYKRRIKDACCGKSSDKKNVPCC